MPCRLDCKDKTVVRKNLIAFAFMVSQALYYGPSKPWYLFTRRLGSETLFWESKSSILVVMFSRRTWANDWYDLNLTFIPWRWKQQVPPKLLCIYIYYMYVFNALLVLAYHMTTFARQTFRIRSWLCSWHYCCKTKQLWQYIFAAWCIALRLGKGKVVPAQAVKAYKGSSGTIPLLNLGTKWRWVVTSCPTPLIPVRRTLYLWSRRLCGLQSHLNILE